MMMGKPDKFNEYDFLFLFYQQMLALGQSHNLIRLSVNARMVEEIYEKSKIPVNENELQDVADICLANRWIERTTMGGDQYCNFLLTTAGFGVVKSKLKQTELLANRTFFKKASDSIVEHKGIIDLAVRS